MGIEEEHWEEYLGRILTGLRGWAAMSFWMGLNPWYPKQKVQPMDVVEYLAVRLFYETLLVSKLCKTTWQIDARVTSLRHYFEIHPSEFFVRRELFLGHLPEYLAGDARALVAERSDTNGDEPDHIHRLNPWYPKQKVQPMDVVEYLAVRLFYETLLVSKLCKTTWQIDARVTSLRHYFEIHPSEFFVRRELFLGHLPEYLAGDARALVSERSDTNGDEPDHWKAVADKIWMAREVLAPRRRVSETVWRPQDTRAVGH